MKFTSSTVCSKAVVKSVGKPDKTAVKPYKTVDR